MWKYEDEEIGSIEDMPEGAIGFIYEVTHLPSNKKYIGKKLLEHKKTLPPLKGKKRKRRSVKESDWHNYYGSNQDIKILIKEGKESEFSRKILMFAFSKIQLTYLETKLLFIYEVLENDDYFNSNILGKFYKGRV